jgi:type I restriction modification DNA specificity protein
LVEAVEQLRRAIAQIATLPTTSALRREEIKLQAALINALMHTKGYAAPETMEAEERARSLIEAAETLGEAPEDPLLIFSVLYGFWVANQTKFNGELICELAAKFLASAEKEGTIAPRMIGHRLMGTSLPDDVAESYDVKSFTSRSKKFLQPTNWTIEPLSRVSSHIVDCPHTTPKWTSEGFLCAKSEQIMAGYLDLSTPYFVSEETYIERIERLRPEPDDILFKREGGILGVACRILEGIDLCLGQRLMLIRSNDSISAKFLELVLNSRWITEYAKEKTTGGAAPRVNMALVRGFPIPLPPLAEQHRILEKFSKLVKLCDSLKLRLAGARVTEVAFADAVASRAVSSRTVA